MARSTGSMRSKAVLSPPTMTAALPCASVTGLPEIGASSMATPLLGEFGGDRAARVRRDRAHVDIDAALLQAGDDAVAAERDCAHRRRVGYDREHDVAAHGDRARRFRQSHAGGNQRLGLLLAPVPAGDRVSRGHEPRDNAGTHGAQPNETDVHASPRWISRSAMMPPNRSKG